MAWLPEELLTKTLDTPKMWAQHVKQFLVLISGIETKSQEEMDRGARENFIMAEFSRWVEILEAKYPGGSPPMVKVHHGDAETAGRWSIPFPEFSGGVASFPPGL